MLITTCRGADGAFPFLHVGQRNYRAYMDKCNIKTLYYKKKKKISILENHCNFVVLL